MELATQVPVDAGLLCEQIVAAAAGRPAGIGALDAQCLAAARSTAAAHPRTSRLILQAKLVSAARSDFEIEWRGPGNDGSWRPSRCPHGPRCNESCAVEDPAHHDAMVKMTLARWQVPTGCIELIFRMWRPAHERGASCRDFNVGAGPALLLRCRATNLPWARLAALPGSSAQLVAACSVDIVRFLSPPALAVLMVAALVGNEAGRPGEGACDFIHAMTRKQMFWNVVLQQGEHWLRAPVPGAGAGGGARAGDDPGGGGSLVPFAELLPMPCSKVIVCGHARDKCQVQGAARGEPPACWSTAAEQVFRECWVRSEKMESSVGCDKVWSSHGTATSPAWAARWEWLVRQRLHGAAS
jgi:hypothetical protein